ncbi:MAG TPA: hypothetical protein VG842_12965, partial [Sediminibacterium sp.]|nr:hypothetical protein [Sediminibacterium sp.]
DDFTLSLLTNDEVIALDQDPMGRQAKQVQKADKYQVWMKPLQDGSHAIGIFNLSDTYQDIRVAWNKIGLTHGGKLRDLWRQKDLGSFADTFDTKVPPHGVRLVRLQ